MCGAFCKPKKIKFVIHLDLKATPTVNMKKKDYLGVLYALVLSVPETTC